MKHILHPRILIITALLSVPLVAVAQQGTGQLTSGIGDLAGVADVITQKLLRSLATLFATAAMGIFFFGIAQYIWGAREGDDTKIKNGNKFMRWGLVALFVMFSIWGIVTYVQRIFRIEGQNTIIIPQIEFMRGSGNNTPARNNANASLPASPTTIQTGTNAGDCANKTTGQSCTVSGRVGTCTVNDFGVYGCYANAITPVDVCPNGTNADGDCIVNGTRCERSDTEIGQWQNGVCVI